MPSIKRISIRYFKNRVKRRRKIPQSTALERVAGLKEDLDDVLKLELEILLMIGAPAS